MPGVMADQRKALADTTELTDTVYFVHPTGIRTLNLWVSEQIYCNFADYSTSTWLIYPSTLMGKSRIPPNDMCYLPYLDWRWSCGRGGRDRMA